jgi:hypothetical protein
MHKQSFLKVRGEPKLEKSIVNIQCGDLTQGCGNAEVQIKTDRSPQVMKPFHLYVKAAGVKSLAVDFSMQGMPMGLNRYRLIQQADVVWYGEVILPACVQGRSDWLMEVDVTTTKAERLYHVAFQSTK